MRARIPGWGADLDPADRPSYPKLQYAPDSTGAHWDFPERQPERWPRERSIEHAFVTPVFGTAQPPQGALRARSGSCPTPGTARGAWPTGCCSILADRIDAWEEHLRSFATTRPDNPVTETGVRAEFTHHGLSSRKGRVDARHQVLDPVIVAGPWLAAAGGAAVGVRRLVRAVRR